MGIPYQFGATSGNTDTFDCSSYTQYVFRQFGIDLPRTAAAQATIGAKVDPAYLSVGDLVFFRTNGRSIGHVAIYAGDGLILHASSSKGISYATIKSGYWKDRYVTAKRILE